MLHIHCRSRTWTSATKSFWTLTSYLAYQASVKRRAWRAAVILRESRSCGKLSKRTVNISRSCQILGSGIYYCSTGGDLWRLIVDMCGELLHKCSSYIIPDFVYYVYQQFLRLHSHHPKGQCTNHYIPLCDAESFKKSPFDYLPSIAHFATF
jgi:hypothetical protein